MSSLKKIVVVSAVALLISLPDHAYAQSRSEFSAGYDFLRLADDSRLNLPSGWYGEIAWNVTPIVATVGQMTGHYQNLGPASSTPSAAAFDSCPARESRALCRTPRGRGTAEVERHSAVSCESLRIDSSWPSRFQR